MQVKGIAECSPYGPHSAILLPFIKLPFVIKTFVLSIFEWPFFTGRFINSGLLLRSQRNRSVGVQ